MITGRDTLITRLQREMKESPLPVPSPRKIEHPFLADGYERQTDEEPIQVTEKYRRRTIYMIMRLLIIAIALATLAFVVMKSGIITI